MTRPLVHIGYHKTATSWLQKYLFADPDSGFETWFRPTILEQLVNVYPLEFDARACRDRLRPPIGEALEKGLVPVISHERLSGYPASGGFDSSVIADRLFAVLPEANVLIVIRRQEDVIASSYFQYVADGGAAPLRRYLDPAGGRDLYAPTFRLSFYEYHRLIEYYSRLFGDRRVLVLPYEGFQEAPLRFLRSIVEFSGANREPEWLELAAVARLENPSLSGFGVLGLRWANLLWGVSALTPSPPLPLPILRRVVRKSVRLLDARIPRRLSAPLENRYRRIVRTRCEGVFHASNLETSRLLGEDLRKYAYQ